MRRLDASLLRFSIFLGGLLAASGFVHLVLLLVFGAEWEGPVSFRKPGLFGVSAAMTIWSLVWVVSRFSNRRWSDEPCVAFVSVSLVLEVALITMQFWREVASHFNSATSFDAGMEGSMLALITVAVAGIAWIFVRSLWSPDPDPDFRLASRAGLLFLLLSCAIGYAITFVGHWNMLQGRSPEVFGPAGVLKFPHGAALHALQWLPLLVVMGKRWKLPQTRSLLQSAIVIQGLLLTHAIWQTVSGRGRTEFTVGGFLMLLAAALIAGWTLVTILRNLNPRRASLESQSIGT